MPKLTDPSVSNVGTLAATDRMMLARPGNGAAFYTTAEAIRVYAAPGYNVVQYGAVGDGATDDTAAIQATINAMGDNNTIYFPPGDYSISDALDFRDKSFITIECNQARIIPRSGVSFANKPVINLCGTNHSIIHNLNIVSSIVANIPSCAVLEGRTIAQPGGGNLFDGCFWQGYFADAVEENICQEVNTHMHCVLLSMNASPCIYDSSLDTYSRTGVESSNIRKSYYSCTIANYSTGGCVVFNGLCQEAAFRDCYLVDGTGAVAVNFIGAVSHWGMIFDNTRIEGTTPSANARFIKVASTTSANNLTIRNLVWGITSDAIIEIAGYIAVSSLDVRCNNNNVYILVDGGATLRSSQIYFDKASTINVLALGYANYNILIGGHTTPGNPFTGAGYYENEGQNTNIALSPGYAHGGSPIKTGRTTITNGDTTPTVSGFGYLIISNSAPTSITNFDDPVYGQEITIHFGNGNTTLVNGVGTLALSGTTNWNAPTGAMIKLVYDSSYGYWFETSRMVP